MSADTEAVIQPIAKDEGPNPWRFIPVLYVLQAIPVTLIQETATLFYKDFGIPNDTITTWTSLIALPWGLQFLLGPLVDLSAQKRRWVLGGQLTLTLLLAILPFLIFPGATAFAVSLMFMACAAICSALTNIATDGFYLLCFTKEIQARFAGIQSACYRVGRLFVSALLPFIAGMLMNFNAGSITTGGNLHFKVLSGKDKRAEYLRTASLKVEQGELKTLDGKVLVDSGDKPITIEGMHTNVQISNGVVTLGDKKFPLGLYTLDARRAVSNLAEDGAWAKAEFPTPNAGDTFAAVSMTRKLPAPYAWGLAMFGVTLVYGALAFSGRRSLPSPDADTAPTEQQTSEFGKNIQRTLAILGFYGSTYFAISGVWRLIANTLSGTNPALKGWTLKDEVKFFNFDIGLTGVQAELFQVSVCVPVAIALLIYIRNSLKGSEMGTALSTFFRQSGIVPIIFFMFFYRFAEAMVNKIVPLFLKDSLESGGLAYDNQQIGLIKGTIGVIGIIIGGIVGGIVVSKVGLKKGFWLIAVLMHLPITLYLIAAITRPANIGVISVIEFADQFGYGLGYAGYSVYLMRVAQRGNYATGHYAIGTGIGATIISVAGILSGVLQANFGFANTFAAALLLGIPGVLTLKFIPHDEATTSA